MKLKRIFDLLFAIPGLIVFSPLMACAAIWIKYDSSGPVFFRQERVGRFGQPFRVYKFRTMVSDAEQKGAKITSAKDTRITSCGAFLRKYKIDELPQLINVIKGEMSLVGPRPEVPEYVAQYPIGLKEFILSVPPGITDLASIHFRNENELLREATDPHRQYIEEILPVKLRYCEEYVLNRTIYMDFYLVLKTLVVLVRTTD